MSVVEYLKI
ncbi:hypothetical protein VCHC02C1_1645A, partial [Vibrio cholerae HC-02C1]